MPLRHALASALTAAVALAGLGLALLPATGRDHEPLIRLHRLALPPPPAGPARAAGRRRPSGRRQPRASPAAPRRPAATNRRAEARGVDAVDAPALAHGRARQHAVEP